MEKENLVFNNFHCTEFFVALKKWKDLCFVPFCNLIKVNKSIFLSIKFVLLQTVAFLPSVGNCNDSLDLFLPSLTKAHIRRVPLARVRCCARVIVRTKIPRTMKNSSFARYTVKI